MSDKSIIERTYRLRDCFSYLKNNGLVSGYPDIANAMGIPYASVRAAFSPSSTYISTDFIEIFLKSYPNMFSRTWLMDGIGRMLQPGADIIVRQARYPLRWQRVQYIMDTEGLTYKEFSKEIGLKNSSTIYRTINQYSRPQDGTLIAILKRFPRYSKEWLFEGKGPIMASEVPKVFTVPKEVDLSIGNALPSDISMPEGLDNLNNIEKHKQGIPIKEPVNLEDVIDADYGINEELIYSKKYYFVVRGRSMDNGSNKSLLNGDILLCYQLPKKILRYRLKEEEEGGKFYVLVTKSEGIIVKTIVGQNLKSGEIRCGSLNEDYLDIVVNKKDIISIYVVSSIVQRQL